MYAYVRNIFNVTDDSGNKPLYIEINTVEQFNVYEFFQKLQLIKEENPYDVNRTLGLDDITNGYIAQINSDITKLINEYSYLGTITHKIDIKHNVLYITIDMILNKSIDETNSRYITKTIEYGGRC